MSAWVVPDEGMGMLPEAGRPAGPGFGDSTPSFWQLTRHPVGWLACLLYRGTSGNGTSTADAT
jgi:hypothetical protein